MDVYIEIYLHFSFFYFIQLKDLSTRISFAVYETSVLFDLNSSQLQSLEWANCSNLMGDQIVTNVVSISSNKMLFSDKKFVTTKFRTLPVFKN